MLPPLPIAELADLLHAAADPRKTLLLLRAYFDESGIDRNSLITAVGGLVGDKDTWVSLEGKWLAVIDDFREHGLTAFHAVDCVQGEGEFARIAQPIREAIHNRFARVIADHDLAAVWCAVIQEDWNATEFGERFRRDFPKPFYLCFSNCAQRLVGWSARFSNHPGIALVYSEQKEFQNRVGEIWDAYYRAKNKAGLRSFATASYRDCIPLQAADLFAYEMNLSWRDREYGEPPPPLTYRERWPLHYIGQKISLFNGGCYDAQALTAAQRRLEETGEI